MIKQDKKHDHAGALLLACTILIFKKIIIREIRIVFIKINSGFLLCTGNLNIFTFFLSTNLSNPPPLVTINDLQLFSDK